MSLACGVFYDSVEFIEVPLSDQVNWPDIPVAMPANPQVPAGLCVISLLDHELGVDVQGNAPALSFYVDYSQYGWLESQFSETPSPVLSVTGVHVATVELEVPKGRFCRVRIVPLPGNGPDTTVKLALSGR